MNYERSNKVQYIKAQRGATLIVALILLAVMTTLGFTSLRSTNIQQSIIKNNQFLASARNVAFTEINAHIDCINIDGFCEWENPDGNNYEDQMILDIMDQVDADRIEKEDNGTPTGFYIIADDSDNFIDGLNTPQTAFTQSLKARYDGAKNLPGYDIGSGYSSIVGAEFTTQSHAELNSTAASSTQQQGYYYVMPDDGS